jgi:hypothetical protein
MQTRASIYRRAVQRTFADLYSVSPDAVDVTWANDGESITVRCAGKTFSHRTGSAFNEFVSDDDDPVTVTLTDDERNQLKQAI